MLTTTVAPTGGTAQAWPSLGVVVLSAAALILLVVRSLTRSALR
jgi:hypothetical protein